MKLNEKEKKGVLVLALLFVVYTLIVLAVPFAKGGMFWLTYLFTAVAFGVQAYVFKLSFEKEAGAKSKFYGFPIARVGVLYLAVQIVLGLVFMALAAVAPVWLALVLYLALLVAAAVGVIATDSIRDEVERQDTQLKKNVATMRALQSKAAALPARCEDAPAKAALEKLAEEFRYSDPVSAPTLVEMESSLTAALDELETAVVDADNTAALDLCKTISVTLAKRNQLCKLNKKQGGLYDETIDLRNVRRNRFD